MRQKVRILYFAIIACWICVCMSHEVRSEFPINSPDYHNSPALRSASRFPPKRVLLYFSVCLPGRDEYEMISLFFSPIQLHHSIRSSERGWLMIVISFLCVLYCYIWKLLLSVIHTLYNGFIFFNYHSAKKAAALCVIASLSLSLNNFAFCTKDPSIVVTV